MKSVKQEGKKVVKGSSQEIADMLADEKDKKQLMEPGAHNILIYNDLKILREIYSQYSKALLTENEIVVIASQYDTTSNVINTLRLAGIDIEKYLNQGTLFIIDAQPGYQDADSSGIWKLCKSLISRARKEDRRGVTLIGDLGSFFNFEKIENLMQYELSLPQKYEDTMKGICCYHLEDFEKLTEAQKNTLFDHHFKSLLVKKNTE
jgi:MEDS: MEthanogen/methylotroph, DcmR Sensory domain